MQLIYSILNARYLIENKIKVLTIRTPWKNGKGIPKIGETLYLKDGNRFIKRGMPGCLKPILINGKNPKCTGVWPIKIEKIGDDIRIETDFFVEQMGFRFNFGYAPGYSDIPESKLQRFAIMDGWDNFSKMIEFFKKTHGLPFGGNLIYWGER